MSFRSIPYSVYLLALCQALMMSSTSLLITASSLVCLTLTPDKSLVTLPLSLQFFGLMLTSMPASLLMGRLGRKQGFLIGTLFGIVGASLLVYAVFNNLFWLFAVGSFLIGIFNGFGIYYRFAAVDMVNEENRPKAISYVLVGGVIAAFVGPNLANFGQTMFPSEPFAGGFIYATIIYVLVFVVISFIKFPGPLSADASLDTAQKAVAPRSLGLIVRQPMFIVAVICGMLGYAIMSYLMTATPLAMNHHSHGFSDSAFVIQWHVFAMFAPSFFTGNIIQRFGVLNVMLVGAMLAVICVVINLTGVTLWHFWAALVALGVSWNFLFIGATSLLTQTYREEEKSKAQGFNDFAVFTLVTIASLSAGMLQHKFGWEMVNYAALPFIAIIMVSVFWLKMKPIEQALKT
ncbi:MAG: MFS transporter [Cocleimonas sp.]